MAGTYADLAEHTGALVAIIGLLLVVCGTLIGWILNQIRVDLKEVKTWIIQWIAKCGECKGDLKEQIHAAIQEVMEIRDREWKETFWPHRHFPSGEVKVQRNNKE